jgi:hypothetical protein
MQGRCTQVLEGLTFPVSLLLVSCLGDPAVPIAQLARPEPAAVWGGPGLPTRHRN